MRQYSLLSESVDGNLSSVPKESRLAPVMPKASEKQTWVGCSSSLSIDLPTLPPNNLEELPIIQKTYDLIKWYVPILNKLPRNYRFLLGDRTTTLLYDLLEGLITARYSNKKLSQLESLNANLDILRYQSRLMLDFNLIDVKRYEYISQHMNAIGTDLGGWIRQQRQREKP